MWRRQAQFLSGLVTSIVTPAQRVERLAREEKTMRHTRIIVTHHGGPEELQVVEEECPEPKAGEVRVRTRR